MDASRIKTLEEGMAYEQSREGPPQGSQNCLQFLRKDIPIRFFLISK